MKWILLLIFMMSISFILFCCHTGNSVYCRYQFGKLRFCSDTVDWGTIYLGRTYQKCLEIYNPDTMKIPLRIVNCISGIKVYHKSILAAGINLTRLPEPGIKTVRVIRIGDYDQCACIGLHVTNTAEIGTFRIISFDFNDGVLRIRFKLGK